MAILYTAYLIVALIMLWKGADNLVESAAKIAYTLGISQLVIGLTVVAFGTSAPEFVVTINAALRGESNISVSNVIGSNIFNLGFILGGVAIVRTIQTTKKLIYRDGMVLLATVIAILIFLWDLHFSRWEALVLFSGLFIYLMVLFIKKEPLEEVEIEPDRATYKDYLRLVLSIAVVIIGGHFLVEGAVGLARIIGISEWVIGVTIVAAGTSAPEFATSLLATIRGHHGLSAGNLIGSDLFNLLGVLGLAGIIRPMTVTSHAHGSTIMLVGMIILVLILMRTGWKLSRWEGILLVVINLIRWILDYIGG
ncbi:MAG: calcium/sodium antiporter [Calditrichia bacterium]